MYKLLDKNFIELKETLAQEKAAHIPQDFERYAMSLHVLISFASIYFLPLLELSNMLHIIDN